MTGVTNAPPLDSEEVKKMSVDLVEAAGELENMPTSGEPREVTVARRELAKRLREHADRLDELLTGKRIIP